MNIRIETSAEKSALAAEAWKNQYFNDGKWAYVSLGLSDQIYKDVLECYGDPDKIAKVIGHKDWSHVYCSICQSYVDIVVICGTEDTIGACRLCLGAAEAALDAFIRATKNRS